MIASILQYWRRPIGHIEVYRYHLEKVGHSLMLGLLFAPVAALAGLSAPQTTFLAAVSYLTVGKLLQRSRVTMDHAADMVIGLGAVPLACFAVGDIRRGGVILVGLVILYAIAVLWKRRASP